jgi:TonB family protein
MSIPKYVTLLLGALTVSVASVVAFGLHPSQSSEQPAVVSAAAPIFPPIAAAARAIGEVIVEVKINRAGEVTSTKTQGAHPLLRKACEIAAARWKFAPAGEGVGDRSARITFVFRITDKEKPETEITPVFMPPYRVEVTRNAPVIETYRSH